MPVGSIPAQTLNVGETVRLDVTSYFRDPDGGALTYAAASLAPGVVSVSQLGSVLTMVGVAEGSATVTVTATDPTGLSAAQNVAVTVVTPNRAPEAVGSIPAQSLDTGETVTLEVSGYFRDPDGDVLTYTAATSAAGVLSVSISGSSLTMVGVAAGRATVTVTATDPEGLAAAQSAAVAVQRSNRAPEAVGSIPAQSLDAGGRVTLDVTGYFRDPDGDALTYTAATSNAGVASVSISGSSLTVVAVAEGRATVTVTAADPGGLTAAQSAAVAVQRSNRAPEAVGSIPAQSLDAGGRVTLDVTGYFRDPDGDALTYTAATSNAGVASVSISDSSLTVTGVAEGRATVTVTATDPEGLTAAQSAAVAVQRPNRAPEAVGSIPAQSLDTGETVTLDVTGYFRDPDGDALTYTAATSNAGVASVSISGSSLTVVAVAEGRATVTVTAADPGGLTAAQSAAVAVVTPNRAPEAVGSIPAQSLAPGRTVTLDVSGYFRDPDGDALTYTAATSNAGVASVSISDSSLTVTGVAEGTATVTVTAADPGGLTAVQSAAVTVVTPNRAPEAVGTIPAQSLNPGQARTVDVSSYFRDPDGDALTYTAVTSNARVVSASMSGRSLTVTGVAEGTATVTVTATDPDGLTATQTVAVTVENPDRAALVALYEATSGPDWLNKHGWLTDAPLGEWYGVETDASGRVVGLDLGGGLSERINHGLAGPLPRELGDLDRLVRLELGWNSGLSGAIPPELGNLASLEELYLGDNGLTGGIPPELGQLHRLEVLWMGGNDLSGSLPPELGGMSSLRKMVLSHNPRLSGPIPLAWTALSSLESLEAAGTDLCAPGDARLQSWLGGVYLQRIAACTEDRGAAAYLVQAVQSREHPVPLVAGRRALLRVFVTAARETTQTMPAVQARFYLNGAETHVARIAPSTVPIPTEINEGTLPQSANAEIPARVLQPGLEMVIDVDPDGTLDPSLRVAKRIPAEGRLPVDVQEVPSFDLTLIPFIWSEQPDSSIVSLIGAMAADPEHHELLEETRTLLPVDGFTVRAHEPVLSSSNNGFTLWHQASAIRVMEGRQGHYMAMMSGSVRGPLGVAYLPGWSSYASPRGWVIAHELGHNLHLAHPPCGAIGDPAYPYANGLTGAWGYDFTRGVLTDPTRHRDVMSYCAPRWISDYSFANALRFRVSNAHDVTLPDRTPATRSLLVWGGIDDEGNPFLEPTFVIDAPAALPDSAGEYRLAGRSRDGGELFSFTFPMPEAADGDGSSSFVFALPIQSGWEGLASITLVGPGGLVTLDEESNRPMAIVRNRQTGQVRGFLRDPLPTAQAAAGDAARRFGGPGVEVLFSRGIPDLEGREDR